MLINLLGRRITFYAFAALFVCVITWNNGGCGVQANMDMSQLNVNDLQRQLPGELAKTNLSLDDAKTMFRNKCIEVAGDDAGNTAFTDIESGILTLGECVNTMFNYTVIQSEIDKAIPHGELDVVFNKYCSKRPKAVECIESFNAKLVPCLDSDERKSQKIVMHIIRSLLDFVCHQDGNQIALFIAEKGPECLKSKKDDIQQCINSTFSGYMPDEGIDNVKTIPKLVMGQKQCEDILTLETCIVKHLETCEDITPANIVESMFKFIKNETICRNTMATASAKQSAGNYSSQFMPINGMLLTFVLFIIAISLKKSL